MVREHRGDFWLLKSKLFHVVLIHTIATSLIVKILRILLEVVIAALVVRVTMIPLIIVGILGKVSSIAAPWVECRLSIITCFRIWNVLMCSEHHLLLHFELLLLQAYRSPVLLLVPFLRSWSFRRMDLHQFELLSELHSHNLLVLTMHSRVDRRGGLLLNVLLHIHYGILNLEHIHLIGRTFYPRLIIETAARLFGTFLLLRCLRQGYIELTAYRFIFNRFSAELHFLVFVLDTKDVWWGDIKRDYVLLDCRIISLRVFFPRSCKISVLGKNWSGYMATPASHWASCPLVIRWTSSFTTSDARLIDLRLTWSSLNNLKVVWFKIQKRWGSSRCSSFLWRWNIWRIFWRFSSSVKIVWSSMWWLIDVTNRLGSILGLVLGGGRCSVVRDRSRELLFRFFFLNEILTILVLSASATS